MTILQTPPTPLEYWNGTAWVPKPSGIPADWVKASMAEISGDPTHDQTPLYYTRARVRVESDDTDAGIVTGGW